MISRRYRVQERRTTRRAFFLILASIGLLLVLIFFGIPALARFAVFVSELRGSSTPAAQEDKTPPAPPYINQLPKYTQERKITVTGNAEAGSTLKVFNNGTLVKETLVDDTSSFSIELVLSEGENLIGISATDKAGNESEISSPYTVTYDITPPELEITKPQDGESFFGDQKTITIEGKTENEARVTVNYRVAIINADGNFSQSITLSEGENTLVIKAVDQAGNESEKTITVTYSP